MLAVAILLLGVLPLVNGSVHCRCQPSDACWPLEQDWTALNESINGHLVRVRPIGHVCHEPFYNHTSCSKLIRLQYDSNWRAAQPANSGALQSFNWENWPEKHEECIIQTSPNSTCKQGRIPWYSAVVHSVEEIQEAVRFAKQRNIRLVIKNTGHDSSGRSGAPHALQILTNRLKNITFHDNFAALRKDSRVGAPTTTRVPAVTVGAGVMVGELYAGAASQGYIVVAGECTTVGVAGGYLQGGGVSTVLSPMYGLAADHVLELEVVTAQGDVVITNEYQHQDLFWALRGGGGGTYGIVTRATMRVFPDMPSVISTIYYTSPQADDQFWQTVMQVVKLTRSMSVKGNSGQYIVGRLSNFHWFVNWTMFVLNETDSKWVEGQAAPLLSLLDWFGIQYQYLSTEYTKISTFLAIPKQADIGGVGYLQSSRVVSESFMKNNSSASRLVASLSELDLGPGSLVTVNVLGGRVNINTSGLYTSINPHWRSSALLVVLMQSFPPTSHSQAAALDKLTRINTPVLASLDPGSTGVYFNEADPEQDHFQTAFWGPHYERLRRIKNQWDKQGLFMVRKGVGSDDWDAESLCRKNTTARSSAPNYRADALPS